jgi:hypothetical protein
LFGYRYRYLALVWMMQQRPGCWIIRTTIVNIILIELPPP